MRALTAEQAFTPSLAGRHSIGMSVGLHLLPGLLTGALYYLLAEPIARLGLPSIAALMAAGVLVILPFELGVIALAAKSSPQRLAFKDMIAYRQRIPFWQYLVLVPVVFVATGLLFTLLNPVNAALQSLFAWLPDSLMLNIGMEGGFTRSTLLWVTVFNALLLALALPITEELYFRGFLLPRMPESLNRWTPLAHTFLFAVYHFWSPWMIVTRTLGMLPFVYAVQKRNIYIGIVVHCLVNLLDVVTMIVFIASLG